MLLSVCVRGDTYRRSVGPARPRSEACRANALACHQVSHYYHHRRLVVLEIWHVCSDEYRDGLVCWLFKVKVCHGDYRLPNPTPPPLPQASALRECASRVSLLSCHSSSLRARAAALTDDIVACEDAARRHAEDLTSSECGDTWKSLIPVAVRARCSEVGVYMWVVISSKVCFYNFTYLFFYVHFSFALSFVLLSHNSLLSTTLQR